jgi:hypothetical protein
MTTKILNYYRTSIFFGKKLSFMLSENSNVFLVRILLREPADGYGAIGAAD